MSRYYWTVDYQGPSGALQEVAQGVTLGDATKGAMLDADKRDLKYREKRMALDWNPDIKAWQWIVDRSHQYRFVEWEAP